MHSAKTLSYELELADRERARCEFLEVNLLKNSLRWKIDYREVLQWVTKLREWRDAFTITNLHTSLVVYTSETDDITELVKIIAERNKQ